METIVENTVKAETPEDLSTKIKLDARLSISQVITNLITDRKNWQQNEKARSDWALYGVMGKCLILNNSMNGLDAAATALKEAFDQYCTSQNPQIKGSNLMTKIINAVFGMQDRRQTSAYSIVLRYAVSQKWGVIDLPQKIADAGGIEAIRKSLSKTGKSQLDKVTAAKPALSGEVLAAVKNDKLTAKLNKAEYKNAVILLATAEPNGEFHVRRLIQKESTVNTVLASIHTAVAEELKDVASKQKPANDANIRDQAIDDAVAA